MLDKAKIDLNAPAFGAGAQTLEDLKNAPASVEEPEVKVEVESEEIEPSVEETKVPYSRFKKFHDEAKQAREEAEVWRQRAEELEHSRFAPTSNNDIEVPGYFKKLYGDESSPNWPMVQEAWKVQQQQMEDLEKRAYEAGQRGAQELESQQREVIESNVATIDENFEILSDYIGRDLTQKEQSAILDIVDDYTAKDRDGNYLGAIMPFEKAWEVYELKNNSAKTSQRKDRDSVAAITGSQSQGNTDISGEKDKNWNPLARGTWRSRL